MTDGELRMVKIYENVSPLAAIALHGRILRVALPDGSNATYLVEMVKGLCSEPLEITLLPHDGTLATAMKYAEEADDG